MRILLTNDDGVRSPGIHALLAALEGKHEVWVFAPDGERSGMSHRITLGSPVMRKKLGERVFACSGTPADCVLLALLGALPCKPDIVISGINLGPNIGTDIIYSGTAAAARQAALMRVPGVAVSLDAFSPPYFFEPLARFIAANALLLAHVWEGGHFVNINAPNVPSGESYAGAAVTFPSLRRYQDKLSEFTAPGGESYYFLHNVPPETDREAGSDWDAVVQGKISVSPVALQPVGYTGDARYQDARFALDT
ncbi:MAG: 5'/3'-nucleotidase SurE [Spirochaetales bacterium]|jgi:5'-nucleotidase|nr:5'/3'-nucleotidase SurE [Spirochaetales bacterium]